MKICDFKFSFERLNELSFEFLKSLFRLTDLKNNAEPNAKSPDVKEAKENSSLSASKDRDCVKPRLALGHKDDALSAEERERCLRLQVVLQNVPDELIRKIIKAGKPRVYQKDDLLIRQGDPSGSVFFILSGSVDVLVNGVPVAIRKTSEVVGEMSALDPGQKRSASIVARETTRVLMVSNGDFGKIISEEQAKSQFLFNIARVTAGMLRDRGDSIRSPNIKPVVFIGSSTEAENVVSVIREGIEKGIGGIEVIPWSDSKVFQPSASTMESLEEIAKKIDFAVMILSPDDRTWFRGKKVYTPRDNVVFELGLFMGYIGRLRCFYIVKGAKVPTDIIGDTRLTYHKSFWSRKIHADEAISRIVAQIKKQGVRK